MAGHNGLVDYLLKLGCVVLCCIVCCYRTAIFAIINVIYIWIKKSTIYANLNDYGNDNFNMYA